MSNISQSILAPRFQIDAKIYSANLVHKITADYFSCKPESKLTETALVYKNYDPVTGETYYEGFKSDLAFHRIRLQYDLGYRFLENDRMDLFIGGNFACNALRVSIVKEGLGRSNSKADVITLSNLLVTSSVMRSR